MHLTIKLPQLFIQMLGGCDHDNKGKQAKSRFLLSANDQFVS